LADEVGTAAARRALRLPRSAVVRDRAARNVCPLPDLVRAAPARRPPMALSELEPRVVLDVLNRPRFADCTPSAIHAQLLDEGRYVALMHTMNRLLQGCAAVRERRNQLAPALEPFAQQVPAIASPPQHFYEVAAPATKHEHVATEPSRLSWRPVSVSQAGMA
jgi:hypothetical protein